MFRQIADYSGTVPLKPIASIDTTINTTKLIGIQIYYILLPSAFCLLPSEVIDTAT